jgi:hypothetical protein
MVLVARLFCVLNQKGFFVMQKLYYFIKTAILFLVIISSGCAKIKEKESAVEAALPTHRSIHWSEIGD